MRYVYGTHYVFVCSHESVCSLSVFEEGYVQFATSDRSLITLGEGQAKERTRHQSSNTYILKVFGERP